MLLSVTIIGLDIDAPAGIVSQSWACGGHRVRRIVSTPDQTGFGLNSHRDDEPACRAWKRRTFESMNDETSDNGEAISPSTYLLAGQTSELARLQLQSRVWEPSGRLLLREFGDGRGARAVDIGCGVLGWLRLLSEWVGPDGEVVGTDADEAMLAAAQQFVVDEGLGNVVLLTDDVFDSNLEASSFDLVHSRFVIGPLARGAEQMATYCRLARPGGIVALEDWDKGSWHYNPPAPALEQLVGLVDKAFQKVSELDAGRTHLDLFSNVGIDANIHAEVLALPPGHPYLRSPIQMTMGLGPRLNEFVSDEELARLHEQAEAELREPGRWGTTFTVIQSWGRRVD
jgi:SAM-dependent methyltransferase